jgi:hypothetical protein
MRILSLPIISVGVRKYMAMQPVQFLLAVLPTQMMLMELEEMLLWQEGLLP